MNGGPSTVKEQVARMLLGEIAPLAERIEASATMLKESHDHLSDDIRQMAAIVTTLDKTVHGATEQFAYLTAQARTVQAAIARFESAPAQKGNAGISKLTLGLLMVSASLIAAVLAVGAVKLLERDTAEQARVGRAVSRAYKLLDDETKLKLDNAIQKASK